MKPSSISRRLGGEALPIHPFEVEHEDRVKGGDGGADRDQHRAGRWLLSSAIIAFSPRCGGLRAQRFGPLDAATEERLAGATQAQLSRWAEWVLTAGSLEEVLA